MTNQQRYQRPRERTRTEIEILKSRFITIVDRADTITEARDFIATIRAEFPDASHHVYAFCIGHGNSVTEGMSDDGEPAGTSGPPSLAVVRGSDIGDIVLVTARYFGGTKLGTGGLVRAYTEAAQTALAKLPLETKAPKSQIGFDVPYHLYEVVSQLVVAHRGEINESQFAAEVMLVATFDDEDLPKFEQELQEATSGSVASILLQHFDS